MVVGLVHVAWNYPAEGWVKLNVDGASKSNLGKGGGRRVLQDGFGKWLMAFVVKLGICNSMLAEVTALLFGLQLAWDSGFRRVEVSFYFLAMVHLVKGRSNPHNHIACYVAFLMQINTLLSKPWQVQVYRCFREANRVVDTLANIATFVEDHYQVLQNPSAEVRVILCEDTQGISRPRLVIAISFSIF
ncbi:hypothetical protein JCGZ_08257 [Jatropha curcas]|uniref:RNase H type-1 domain-containing protein n=1 Tax=Jatropha curcas TaxID=180498 RepID=A0A067KMV2_JATCU|nr:hypothetical protein JCGZ_08257 [Jatropha curcas]